MSLHLGRILSSVRDVDRYVDRRSLERAEADQHPNGTPCNGHLDCECVLCRAYRYRFGISLAPHVTGAGR